MRRTKTESGCVLSQFLNARPLSTENAEKSSRSPEARDVKKIFRKGEKKSQGRGDASTGWKEQPMGAPIASATVVRGTV